MQKYILRWRFHVDVADLKLRATDATTPNFVGEVLVLQLLDGMPWAVVCKRTQRVPTI